MARMPNAIWKPVCNYSPGQIGHVVGCVIHHMVSDEDSAYRHFNTPGSGASAHFGVDYDGTIYQYVDTGDAAYHACGANYAGQVGIENASASTGDLWQPLTDQQVSACARILAWLADAHGVAVRVADPGDRRGVGYHSLVPGPCTANDWGSTGCPGDAIVAQRGEMVRQAQGGAGPSPGPDVTTWEVDSMLIVQKQRGQAVIGPSGHRPRKLASVNSWHGAVLFLDDNDDGRAAFDQYWQDAIDLHTAALGN